MRLVSWNSKSIPSSFAIWCHNSMLMPFQEPSAFLILNGGPTATPKMSFCLGIAAFGTRRSPSGGSAPFKHRVREHRVREYRTEKQIAGRRALFMERMIGPFSAGSDPLAWKTAARDSLCFMPVRCWLGIFSIAPGTKDFSIHELSQFSNRISRRRSISFLIALMSVNDPNESSHGFWERPRFLG